MKMVYNLNKFILINLILTVCGQNVRLNQGTVIGLKVFPDSARTAVYAYLGIPYAEPPVGDLRFSPPKPHMGWNRTLQAMTMKPICPQLANTVYDETADESLARPTETQEDCLYLNIWIPENGLRFGNLPVLVILTGEDMSYDWPRNRVTGLDIAADGFVVVTVQYRTNIFGWIKVQNNAELTGNYGMLDQALALEWISKNVQSFGGSPNQITLLGHGTSGAVCAFAQFIASSRQGKIEMPFHRMILMSGGNIEQNFNSQSAVQESSKVLIQKLGCQFEENGKQIVSCLRSKSVGDLLRAFDSIYDHGNGTTRKLGPSFDYNIYEVLSNASTMATLPPLVIGITSNEGAFLHDRWLDLARDNAQSLRSYFNYTILRNILFNNSSRHSLEALNWRYFGEGNDENVIELLSAIQRFLSEYNYEIPFYKFLNMLNNSSAEIQHKNNIYAYIYDFPDSMDMRGKTNLFGGASHSSELPLLFGPSLFQQISRRRFNTQEEKIYRKIRTAFTNFIRNSNPSTGQTNDNWQPYSTINQFIYNLGDMWAKQFLDKALRTTANFEKIKGLLERDTVMPNRPNRDDLKNKYLITTNTRRMENFKNAPQISEYASHLRHVARFWQVFIPQGNYIEGSVLNDMTTQRLLYIEATADAARYKQGFFVMLGLVFILMSLLMLCVYLLKRDPLASSTPLRCRL